MRIVSVEIDKKKAKLLESRGWSFDWSEGATDLISEESILKAQHNRKNDTKNSYSPNSELPGSVARGGIHQRFLKDIRDE